VPREAPFSESDARNAIEEAMCWADALRSLGYQVRGANYRTLQRWAKRWGISTDHFDPNARRAEANARRAAPLEEVLVEKSSYHRGQLKRRLFDAGLKSRSCEMCGQGEQWHGMRMSLVLDHVNGVPDDNRFHNLRIVCPNCAATLDTHCGRHLPRERTCPGCNQPFEPSHIRHRYCSPSCWGTVATSRLRGVPHPETRKVERPSLEQLLADLESMSCVAVGRKYGVSDNAIRKWLRWYENEAARSRDAGESEAA
jgi:hypothetical protein